MVCIQGAGVIYWGYLFALKVAEFGTGTGRRYLPVVLKRELRSRQMDKSRSPKDGYMLAAGLGAADSSSTNPKAKAGTNPLGHCVRRL